MPGLLTKKQHWRRQTSNNNLRLKSSPKTDILVSFGSLDFSRFPVVISSGYLYFPTVFVVYVLSNTQLPTPFTTNACAQATSCEVGKFSSDHPMKSSRKRRSVLFSTRVNVILIPCVSEYESAGLAPLLWWTDEDYLLFKQYALQEVKEFMLCCKIVDAKEAIRQLYQTQHVVVPQPAVESKIVVVHEIDEPQTYTDAEDDLTTSDSESITSPEEDIESSDLADCVEEVSNSNKLRTMMATFPNKPSVVSSPQYDSEQPRFPSRTMARYLMNK
jgi:hypothetical protein